MPLPGIPTRARKEAENGGCYRMLARYTLVSAPSAARRCVRISLLGVLVLLLAACAIPPWSDPKVVLLVSDSTPAYTRVADALKERLSVPPRVLRLKGDARQADAAVQRLADNDDTIVAIGALALQTARRLNGRHVVFCQVFNYEEPGLLAPTVSGVKAMPPLTKQFRAWKLLDPRLNRIALITGPGLRDLPKEAKQAAAEIGLSVVHIAVNSDKELLYTTRDQLDGVQGVWVAPDYRILSKRALRELLSHAVRQGIAVMVFNHQLLDEGAVMSAESDYGEVADRVVDLVRAPARGSRLVSLTRARVKVNDLVAAQLGLSSPPIFERGIYVF